MLNSSRNNIMLCDHYKKSESIFFYNSNWFLMLLNPTAPKGIDMSNTV